MKLPPLVESFVQAGPTEARRIGYGLALVIGALWHTFMSVLVTILVGLFIADLVLGVFRAVHRGGTQAFDWDRFERAFLKMGAAVVGIAVFRLGDLLLEEGGMPPGSTPLTSAFLFGACWGFFWSSIRNLGYFFPNVDRWIDRAMGREKEGGESARPMDQPTEQGGGPA